VGLGCLGPIEVRVGGALVELGGPQQRRLLGVLAVNAGRTVPGDELIAALFPGEGPERAGSSLRSYLSRLRRALARGGAPDGLIVTDRDGWRLDVALARLDVDRFEELGAAAAAAVSVARWEEAAERADAGLALWRGRPFSPFADEQWARVVVARLEARQLALLEDRAQALVALGRGAGLVGELQALCAAHPTRERLRAQLALALARSGRQAEALRAIDEHRRRLATDTGLEVGPALAALERQILANDPSLLAPEPPAARLRSYEPGPLLGEGAFALVYRGTNRRSTGRWPSRSSAPSSPTGRSSSPASRLRRTSSPASSTPTSSPCTTTGGSPIGRAW
jgi:DNA-binding SARP family transcriptional activator